MARVPIYEVPLTNDDVGYFVDEEARVSIQNMLGIEYNNEELILPDELLCYDDETETLTFLV